MKTTLDSIRGQYTHALDQTAAFSNPQIIERNFTFLDNLQSAGFGPQERLSRRDARVIRTILDICPHGETHVRLMCDDHGCGPTHLTDKDRYRMGELIEMATLAEARMRQIREIQTRLHEALGG